MTLEHGALLHNRYRIVEILGQGGMGAVYRAVDENLGVDVAVKENLFTTVEYARQFRLEAVILAKLRHPNLTRVTDHFVIGDQGQYLVMDYIEGEDLRQRMERTRLLPDDEVILIGAAVCKALSYLHSRQPLILHRDVKPGNVKISPDGEIFLVDFGLAKIVQGSQITTTGARAMTPGYSPPEQYGTARTDPRTDIYSLGATLYAALTGVIPEDGLARAMENTKLTPVRKRASKVSRRLAAAVEKAMEVDADDRFQTADEFRKALLSANSKTQRLIEHDFTVSPSPSTPLPVLEDNLVNNLSLNDVPTIPPTAFPAPTTGSPRQRRRKSRKKFIRFLIWMILLIGSVAALAFYFPQIKSYFPALAFTPEPTATQALPVLATEKATVTLVPTPTNTPKPTLTSTPTNTPTSSPTPTGGGTGEIAFASDRTGTSQIYLINADGSNLHPITNITDGACQPDWSPDGKRIVFVSPCTAEQNNFKGASLYIIDAEGTNLTQLSSVPGGDFEPAWSPDGKHIAFTSLRDGYMQIYALNLHNNTVQRLTETPKDEYARQPAWSPFGNQIAYTLRRYGSYQLWVMSDTGKTKEQLTRSGEAFWDLNPVWSPDGKIILYSQHLKNNNTKVWLMNILYANRGAAGIEIAAKPLPIRDVSYSADGFWLIFEGRVDRNPDIYIMTVAGASRVPVTTDPANDYDPVWRPLP